VHGACPGHDGPPERSTTIAAMDLLKPLIALLAIVNPIGVVPFFIHFTQTFSREQRRRTIRISAFTAFW
jgi:small neutral amino acid transporter SnatA (MarC family)